MKSASQEPARTGCSRQEPVAALHGNNPGCWVVLGIFLNRFLPLPAAQQGERGNSRSNTARSAVCADKGNACFTPARTPPAMDEIAQAILILQAASAGQAARHETAEEIVQAAVRAGRQFQLAEHDSRKHDLFISYYQAGSSAVAGWLCERLRFRERMVHGNHRSLSVWFDRKAETIINAEGIEQGVSQSRNFLIFLSPGYMSRPWCQAECRWAKLYGCNIVGIALPRMNISSEREAAPPDLKHLFGDVVFQQWQSQEDLQTPMISTILNQCEWPCNSDRAPLLGGSFVLVDDDVLSLEEIIREMRGDEDERRFWFDRAPPLRLQEIMLGSVRGSIG